MEELSGETFISVAPVMSASVALISLPFPYEPGTEVTLGFGLPGSREMVVARGKLRKPWARSGWHLGMGVKFISIEGNGRDRKCFSYIDKLKA